MAQLPPHPMHNLKTGGGGTAALRPLMRVNVAETNTQATLSMWVTQRLSLVEPAGIVSDWKPSDVSHWLETHGMGEYIPKFLEHGVGGSELVLLEEMDMLALGVQLVGQRKRLKHLITELRFSHATRRGKEEGTTLRNGMERRLTAYSECVAKVLACTPQLPPHSKRLLAELWLAQEAACLEMASHHDEQALHSRRSLQQALVAAKCREGRTRDLVERFTREIAFLEDEVCEAQEKILELCEREGLRRTIENRMHSSREVDENQRGLTMRLSELQALGAEMQAAILVAEEDILRRSLDSAASSLSGHKVTPAVSRQPTPRRATASRETAQGKNEVDGEITMGSQRRRGVRRGLSGLVS